MRELTINELFFVSGAGNAPPSGGGDTSGNGYGDVSGNGNTNNSTKSIGLPKSNITETPGWGAALGTIIGTRIAGKKGGEAGFAFGHTIEKFDWEWYRKYRKVAETYEKEYSGGLP